MLAKFLLAFIPVFVAVDAVGTLPLFIGLTRRVSRRERISIVVQSVITALGLAVGFVFLGRVIFTFLGITMSDFMIAGGTVLFVLAVSDLVGFSDRRPTADRGVGVVPLGTPLIAGPALLTTSLIIIGDRGLWMTLLSVVVNIILAGFIFGLSDLLMRVLGELGTKALSKVTSLLLGAIAVMMIRRGVLQLLAQLN